MLACWNPNSSNCGVVALPVSERKCVHVNLVKRTNVDGEQEYLFAPYSTFTVMKALWGAGTGNALLQVLEHTQGSN